MTALTVAMFLLVLSLGVAHAFAITVDGNPADWGALGANASDLDEAGITQNGRDVSAVYVATDATKMYFRVETWATTLWRSVPSDWAWICLNTDNNTGTGTTLPSQCAGMSGIDYVLELRGTGVGSRTLFSCTTDPGGNCNTVVGGAVTEGASAGTTTEASVRLSDIGNPGSGCGADFTIPTAIYWDGATLDPDDNIGDAAPFNVTIQCPTAVRLSTLTANANSTDTPYAPIAIGLVGVGILGGLVLTLRRKS
jgi:hypothetical protein